MEKKTFGNPYESADDLGLVPRAGSSRANYIISMLWFVPGVISGNELGRCCYFGLGRWLEMFESFDVQQVIQRPIFAIVCFVLTLFWRIPRKYLVSRLYVNSFATFASGVFMILFGMFVTGVGYKIGWLPRTFGAYLITLVSSAILAVEFESIVARLLEKSYSVSDAID